MKTEFVQTESLQSCPICNNPSLDWERLKMGFDNKNFLIGVPCNSDISFYDKIMEGLNEALAYQQKELEVRTDMVEMSKNNPVQQ